MSSVWELKGRERLTKLSTKKLTKLWGEALNNLTRTESYKNYIISCVILQSKASLFKHMKILFFIIQQSSFLQKVILFLQFYSILSFIGLTPDQMSRSTKMYSTCYNLVFSSTSITFTLRFKRRCTIGKAGGRGWQNWDVGVDFTNQFAQSTMVHAGNAHSFLNSKEKYHIPPTSKKLI